MEGRLESESINEWEICPNVITCGLAGDYVIFHNCCGSLGREYCSEEMRGLSYNELKMMGLSN